MAPIVLLAALCIAAAIVLGVLLALAYYVRAIRGIRLLCAREDRTLDTVASVRRAGGA